MQTSWPKELGCNVVEISALKNEGIDEVVNCLKTIGSASAPTPITFSAVAEEAISTIEGSSSLQRSR